MPLPPDAAMPPQSADVLLVRFNVYHAQPQGVFAAYSNIRPFRRCLFAPFARAAKPRPRFRHRCPLPAQVISVFPFCCFLQCCGFARRGSPVNASWSRRARARITVRVALTPDRHREERRTPAYAPLPIPATSGIRPGLARTAALFLPPKIFFHLDIGFISAPGRFNAPGYLPKAWRTSNGPHAFSGAIDQRVRAAPCLKIIRRFPPIAR